MTFQYVGNFISLVFLILGLALFATGMYVGYKYREQLPFTGRKTGMKYLLLGILSLSLSQFALLTVDHGFDWNDLYFSITFVILMSFFLYIDFFIRRRTAIYLHKRNITSYSSARNELDNAIDKMNKYSPRQGADKKDVLYQISLYKNGKSHVIDLSKLGEFFWEKLYILDPYITFDIVKDRLGFAWRPNIYTAFKSKTSSTLLIFTENKRVVHYIYYPLSMGNFGDTGEKIDGISREDAKFTMNDFGHIIWVAR